MNKLERLQERLEKFFSKPDDIWSAARRGDIEAIKKFIAQGAKINDKTDEGSTPLHCSANAGHIEAVKELVRLGAKANHTHLYSAIGGDGKMELVDYFLDVGVDINKSIKGEGTALSLAALKGDEGLVRHLLARGADPNADYTTMDYAVSSKNIKIVEILLQAGAKVNVKSRHYNALATAALWGQIEIMRLLLANGADPNHRDNSNETALMSAVMGRDEDSNVDTENKADILQTLLTAGAEVNVKSRDEQTALDRAERLNLPEIIKILKQAGAKRGSEIAESGNKDNPTTSWELYGVGKSLEGMVLGATLEPWPPAERKAKLNVEVTQDDYGNSFSGTLEYRVVRSEKNSELWIQVFGKTDEDGEFLSSEEIVLARGENFVQFRIKGKRNKDFTKLESWPLKVE